MPELPEVETVRRQIEPMLVGRTIGDAWAFPSTKFTPSLETVGSTIETVHRRGKFLLLGLDDDRELIVHLGMTGVLRPQPADARPPADPYVRAAWFFDGGGGFELRDVRRFGRIQVVERGAYVGTLAEIGPEPFDDEFTADDLWRALRRSRRAIKTQLLSQRPVAGVGNIYADEALWVSRVHPAATSISRARADALHGALREVLAAGLDHGGTTLRDYVTPCGGTGGNQHHLHCYGRSGLPCERCGNPLSRTVLDARTTTFCRVCQRR